MKNDQSAICLVSGGMDSLVTAAIARENCQNIYFLHLNYGQRTEKKELWCFHQIADHYKIPTHHRKVIDVTFLRQIGGSSLTDHQISVKHYKGESNEIPDSYVPFRNTHIVAMAVSWAEVIEATEIFIGAVHEDSSGYPDCRPSYYKAYNALIKEGTKKGNITIQTPIISMNKKEIILKAQELRAPLHLTWSCYENDDEACGICDSCALRLRAFQGLGLEDPISYKTRPRYT